MSASVQPSELDWVGHTSDEGTGRCDYCGDPDVPVVGLYHPDSRWGGPDAAICFDCAPEAHTV